MTRAFFMVALCSMLGGCVGHIGPYREKHREYDPGDYDNAGTTQGVGSLYVVGARSLLEDERAGHVGDVVIIQIDENDSASRQGNTSLSKKSNRQIGLSGGLFDLLSKAVPALQLANLLGIASSSSFDGAGESKRSGKLNASLPVRVRKILPNSDLYLEGSKVVLVGNEEHHLYVSGVVRRLDVRADGTVLSSRVADAEIEYTGRGDISDQQRPGWIHRALDKVSPF